ncbi:hypothetical protein MTR_7g081725 [Medicago truncatula]|uniref:Uncharacterized protein n=1 Tax=Medicago truncatula TaxID=3880 RepID=A0A072UC67_MEDTR|nr:hypothetical protein MTR_7g081725 [Medicago truncatula]
MILELVEFKGHLPVHTPSPKSDGRESGVLGKTQRQGKCSTQVVVKKNNRVQTQNRSNIFYVNEHMRFVASKSRACNNEESCNSVENIHGKIFTYCKIKGSQIKHDIKATL